MSQRHHSPPDDPGRLRRRRLPDLLAILRAEYARPLPKRKTPDGRKREKDREDKRLEKRLGL